MISPKPFRIAAGIAGALLLASCTTPTDGDPATAPPSSSATPTDMPAVWDSSVLHTIEVDYDAGDYESLISAYLQSGEKVWISATVTIDGETFENVGLKLKGNSSLRGLDEEQAESPEDLPWIISLDKYVDGQTLDGASEFAVRSNSAEASLNEALALDVLDGTGLAAEQAIAVSFTAGDSDPALRLVVENPDEAWMERELGVGYLYKAESTGDWSYRGDDPDEYATSFDQKGGDDDLTPLIAFLAFINDSDDEDFAASLPEWLDIDAFATYLAFQDLVQNTDDIDGPGNNAYLYWDPETERMTVVNWDLNLAYGSAPGGGMGGFGDRPDAGAGGGMPEGERPEGFAPGEVPEGFDPPDVPEGFEPGDLPDGFDPSELPADRSDGGFRGMGGMGGGTVLVERFLEVPEFAALYEDAVADLEAQWYESGDAAALLEEWTDLLTAEASHLVDPATVESEEAELLTRLTTGDEQ
ncbi:CotH kinase family protein [Demequina aestuarii]|uniref:CotH kinase family protein n=1 Tax=Demequina aestuarii TaxID=327095 RepID=UPI00078271F0|nr:CotH kinase family protein [Demequina aestuarii]